MFCEDPVPGYRATEEGPRSQREILEMGEPASQPGLVIAAIGVRREPGGLIAPRGQILRQRRIRSVERELPLGIELERPLAGEEAAMRGVRPRGRRQGEVIPNALPRPPRQVGSGVPRIAVGAQVVGAHRVPDDQHDVAGTRGWWRQSGHREVFLDRLPTRRKSRQNSQQAEEPRQRVSHRPRVTRHGWRPRR